MKSFPTPILSLVAVINLISPALAEGFYKNANGLFSTRPGEEKSLQSIDRFGPVGIGIELIQPAFTMRIKN
ncbi:MAG: hypothetical protein ABF379_06205, partial [Akkermansiaceae bacterium]